jgi:hypothetical protein
VSTTELGVFGPLGAVPALDIEVRALAGNPETPVGPPTISVAAVSDGVVIAATSWWEERGHESVAAGLGFDGTVRWQRALDAEAVVFGGGAGAGARTALVAWGERQDRHWELVAGADGTVVRDLVAEDGLAPDLSSVAPIVEGRAGPWLLVVDPYAADRPAGRDGVLLVDLVAGGVEAVPVPEELAAAGSVRGLLAVTADGRLVAYEPGSTRGDRRAAVAVWRGDAWSRDAALLAATPVRVLPDPAASSPGAPLVAWAPDGSERWRRADLTPTGQELQVIGVDGDVVVLQACPTPWNGSACEAVTVGLDTVTGATLWSRPGFRHLPVGAGDGYVLASAGDPAAAVAAGQPPPGWVLVDDRTGTAVAGQQWSDPDAFAAGCCADGQYRHVTRDGGVVVVVHDEDVRVWLPDALSGPTRAVTVP